MQLTPKISWPYNGHNYDTEIQAIEAWLRDIGQKIAKNHSASPVSGLLEYREELAYLLARHAELDKKPEVASVELLEGTRPEEPEGTREAEEPYEPSPMFDQAFDLPEVENEEEAA